MAQNLKEKVHRLVTLHINYISTNVCLIGPFMKYFVLQMEVSLFIMTTVARVVVSSREKHSQGLKVKVAILSQ